MTETGVYYTVCAQTVAMPQLSEKQAYARLTPDQLLDAIESVGLHCDGRFLALNSYENRVYRVGVEDAEPVVGKFYRPQRWSDDAIREEHAFTRELAEAEIPVVAPLSFGGETLLKHELFRFALFPNRGGRAPELDNPDHLEQLGRFVGRIHAVGAAQSFRHRPALDVESFAVIPRQWLLEHDFIPNHLVEAYASLTRDLIEQIGHSYQRAGNVEIIRLHGDLHPGNILWTGQGPHIVDFDDARSGPAIQDLWMFLSGDRDYMQQGLADLLEGYEQFADFNPAELHLLEALRTLRMIHYAWWLATRWDDPAFPRAFPYFNTDHYWEEHILSLREQAAALDEEPLRMPGGNF